MSSITGLISGGGGGGTPINGRAKLDLGGQVLYTDEGGSVWLKTGNVLTTGLENYPDATVKSRIDYSNITADGDTLDLGALIGDPNSLYRSLSFKSDGTRFWVLRTNVQRIYQFNLSTAWNLSTASFSAEKTYTASSQEKFLFTNDGTIAISSHASSYGLAFYKANTPYDITTIQSGPYFYFLQNSMLAYYEGFFNTASNGPNFGVPYGSNFLRISDDDEYLYFSGSSSGILVKIRIPRPGMTTLNASYPKVLSMGLIGSGNGSIDASGERLFVDNAVFDFVDGDLSTLKSVGETSLTGRYDKVIKPDNTKMIGVDNQFKVLYRYNTPNEDYIGVPVETSPNEYLRIK